MLASAIITEVAADLLDTSYERWTEAMLLDYLNAGESHLVYFKPTAYVVTGVYQLIAGTKQALPDGTSSYQNPSAVTLKKAIELIKITRNMGSDGLTSGASIQIVTPQDIDDMFPGWRAVAASATVLNTIFDIKDRTVFEVFPQQPTSSMGWIEAVYSAVPTELAASSESINLSAEYAEPLRNYMKYRAYSMDGATSEFASSRAQAHWNLFLTQIGRKDLLENKYKGKPYDGSNQQL